MGSRDSKYKLDKIVELDEGFFESVDTEKEEEKSQNPESVAVVVRSKEKYW